MQVNATVDSSGLQAGLAYASKYTKRSLPEMVNTSAYWVAVNSKNNLPFVPVERIDAEMAKITVPVIGKRGKPLKRKTQYRGGMSPIQTSKEAPLAVLIIQARANPSSNYNRLTNNRWLLTKSPFKGVSRTEGRAAMRQAEDKQIKSRRRSGKFLIVGWIPAIREMAKWTASKFLKSQPSPGEGRDAFYGGNFGQATPAGYDRFNCNATIENDIGGQGQNAASYNQALMRYGIPATQAAVDREGIEQAKYALKKYDAELCDAVNKIWK